MAIYFKKVGDKMSTSGEKQKKTGEKLISYSEDFKAFGQIFENDGKLDNALESTETAVKVIRNLLAPPVNILKGIGNAFNAIVVPDLDVFTRRIDIPVVGRITIVTGVNVGTQRPFRAIGNSFNDLADDINDIRTTLGDIAKACNDSQAEFGKIQVKINEGSGEIKQAGESLVETGALLSEI